MLEELELFMTKVVPELEAVEIDERAVAHLKDQFPQLTVHHADVVKYDWVSFLMRMDGRNWSNFTCHY